MLLGRGTEDKWYSGEMARKDLSVFTPAGTKVSEYVFEGGHEWGPAFIARAGEFLDELLPS